MYTVGLDGQMTYDEYGDGLSVMGKFPSPWLTPPQLYYLGWLPDSEVGVYEPGKTYVLKRTTDETGNGLSTVIVPPSYFTAKAADGSTDLRYAYVSFSNKCVSQPFCMVLHLSSGPGSQRVAIFGNEYYDENFTGLHIKKLGTGDSTIQVSIDTAPKPSAITDTDTMMDIQDSILDSDDAGDFSGNESMALPKSRL